MLTINIEKNKINTKCFRKAKKDCFNNTCRRKLKKYPGRPPERTGRPA